MNFYEPDNNELDDYPKYRDLKKFFMEKVGDTTKFVLFSRFLNILYVLPASEASAERILARMRDIYDIKQTRLSEDSLRTNLIFGFYEEQKKKEHELIIMDEM